MRGRSWASCGRTPVGIPSAWMSGETRATHMSTQIWLATVVENTPPLRFAEVFTPRVKFPGSALRVGAAGRAAAVYCQY